MMCEVTVWQRKDVHVTPSNGKHLHTEDAKNKYESILTLSLMLLIKATGALFIRWI